MALLLEKNYKGITANYWKIIDVHFDCLSNLTNATMGLYKDQEAREADPINNILETTAVQYDGVDFTRADLYPKVKLEESFATAEDMI
jgi:hypothetical protein